MGKTEPGGICVSGAVRDQVGQRLEDVAFEDLGDQSVKNIARPIRVFRVRLEPDPTTAPEDAKHAAVATTIAAMLSGRLALRMVLRGGLDAAGERRNDSAGHLVLDREDSSSLRS